MFAIVSLAVIRPQKADITHIVVIIHAVNAIVFILLHSDYLCVFQLAHVTPPAEFGDKFTRLICR